MGDDLKGRRPRRNMTSTEDNLNCSNGLEVDLFSQFAGCLNSLVDVTAEPVISAIQP